MTNTAHVSASKTKSEAFIASHVTPRLDPDEVILHTGYLTGLIQARSAVGAMFGAALLRACFIAVSQRRAFFLWSKPGRVGAFSPLLEFGSVQIEERSQITARITRSALFSRSLSLSVNGEITTFHLKRKVRDLPEQSHLIDALCANPMTS